MLALPNTNTHRLCVGIGDMGPIVALSLTNLSSTPIDHCILIWLTLVHTWDFQNETTTTAHGLARRHVGKHNKWQHKQINPNTLWGANVSLIEPMPKIVYRNASVPVWWRCLALGIDWCSFGWSSDDTYRLNKHKTRYLQPSSTLKVKSDVCSKSPLFVSYYWVIYSHWAPS